jgi:hypothetical protein
MQVHPDVPFRPRWIINSEKERENVQKLQKQLGTDLPVVMEPNREPGKRKVPRRISKLWIPDPAVSNRVIGADE